MRAVLLTAAGGPEVLRLTNVPKPEKLGPTEMRVRLRAAALNPADYKARRRGPADPSAPPILGADGAGIVDAIGADVSRFAVGDEVYFFNGGFGGMPGTYAEYTVVDERFAVRKPSNLSLVEAAGVPLVLITAWEALFDRAQLTQGKHVLIHAGAGGVGHVAIQLAALHGNHVATTVSNDEKAALVRQLGAELAITYKQHDFVDAALAWTSGRGVDVCFDTVGGETFARSVHAVRYYGELVTCVADHLPADGTRAPFMRNTHVSFEYMPAPLLANLVDARLHQTQILEEGKKLIEAGKLRIHIGATYPLDEIVEAHRQLEAGSSTGKIVILID